MRDAPVEEDVVPRRHVVHGHGDLRVPPLDVDVPPGDTVVRMPQVVAEILRHRLEQLGPGREGQAPVRVGPERRRPRRRRRGEHALELGQERRREPLALDRVARHEDRVGDLPPELECAARVIRPALVEVGGRRGGERRPQMRRPRGREQVLGGPEIGLAHRAHVPIGIGEQGRPLDRVVTVLRLPDERLVFAATRGEAAAGVLHDHDVAVLDEDVDVAGAPAAILVVGQPREQDGEAAGPVGPVDVRAQDDAVPRRHRHVLVDAHGQA